MFSTCLHGFTLVSSQSINTQLGWALPWMSSQSEWIVRYWQFLLISSLCASPNFTDVILTTTFSVFPNKWMLICGSDQSTTTIMPGAVMMPDLPHGPFPGRASVDHSKIWTELHSIIQVSHPMENGWIGTILLFHVQTTINSNDLSRETL